VAQSVSRRAVTVQTRLRSQASPFEICSGQRGNRAGLYTSVAVFRCYFQSSSDLCLGADKSLARPTSRCILFDGENISFDASLVLYIYIYIYICMYI
jgi:hypothetical protein